MSEPKEAWAPPTIEEIDYGQTEDVYMGPPGASDGGIYAS